MSVRVSPAGTPNTGPSVSPMAEAPTSQGGVMAPTSMMQAGMKASPMSSAVTPPMFLDGPAGQAMLPTVTQINAPGVSSSPSMRQSGIGQQGTPPMNAPPPAFQLQQPQYDVSDIGVLTSNSSSAGMIMMMSSGGQTGAGVNMQAYSASSAGAQSAGAGGVLSAPPPPVGAVNNGMQQLQQISMATGANAPPFGSNGVPVGHIMSGGAPMVAGIPQGMLMPMNNAGPPVVTMGHSPMMGMTGAAVGCSPPLMTASNAGGNINSGSLSKAPFMFPSQTAAGTLNGKPMMCFNPQQCGYQDTLGSPDPRNGYPLVYPYVPLQDRMKDKNLKKKKGVCC